MGPWNSRTFKAVLLHAGQRSQSGPLTGLPTGWHVPQESCPVKTLAGSRLSPLRADPSVLLMNVSPLVGLLTATVASRIHRAAQPALLYLVPFTLLPLLTMAYLKVREAVRNL